jgi:hypothetical protein
MNIFFKYGLGDAAKKVLTGQPVSAIRVTTDNSNYDFDIHKKSVSDFVGAVKCST